MAEMTDVVDSIGSVYRESDRGRWVAQVEAGRSASGRRRYKRRFAATEAEARALLIELRSEAAPLRLGDPSRWSVGRLMAVWLDHLDRAPGTVENYRYAAAKLGPLSTHRAVALLPLHVEQRLRELNDEGLSRSYIGRVRFALGAAYRWAGRQGLMGVNPAEKAELPRDRREHEDEHPLRPDQVSALLQVSDFERNGSIVWLMAVVGLRPAEARAVTLDDVELDQGVLHVRRQLVVAKAGLELGALKTPKSRRDLHLPAALVERLNNQRFLRAQEQLRMGPEWPAEWRRLLYVNEAGKPISQHNLRRWLRRLARDAGLDRDVTPYDLRHGAASMLAFTGVPLEAVSDLLGHASTRTTRGVYVHPLAATQGGAQVLRLVRPEEV